jgi:hypothetical protein
MGFQNGKEVLRLVLGDLAVVQEAAASVLFLLVWIGLLFPILLGLRRRHRHQDIGLEDD